jgi:hypothetical protein
MDLLPQDWTNFKMLCRSLSLKPSLLLVLLVSMISTHLLELSGINLNMQSTTSTRCAFNLIAKLLVPSGVPLLTPGPLDLLSLSPQELLPSLLEPQLLSVPPLSLSESVTHISLVTLISMKIYFLIKSTSFLYKFKLFY